MRHIPESGGIAFGPEPLQAIHVIPADPQEPLPSWKTLWQELSGGVHWRQAAPEEVMDLRVLYPRRPFRGWVGLGRKVVFRIVMPGEQPSLEVLYRIEEAERQTPQSARDLLAGIMGSFWVYVIGKQRQRPQSLRKHASVYMAMLLHDNRPVSPPTRTNRRNLQRYLDESLAGLAGGPDSLLSPLSHLGGVDRIRFWLLVGQVLWQPTTLAHVAEHFRTLGSYGRGLLLTAAVMHGCLTPRLLYLNTPLPDGDVEHLALLFRQALCWAAGGADDDVVTWTLERFGDFEPTSPETWDYTTRAWEVAALLVEDARRRRIYAPRGTFMVSLPEGVPLRAWGVTHLRLRVDEAGMWVHILGKEGKGAWAMRWTPEEGVLPRTLLRDHEMAANHVTFAALWRDMVTAGEAALPQGRGRVRRREAGREHPREQPVPVRPARLPRRRVQRLPLTGERQWGDEGERERIRRTAHEVAGHVRRLPPGHRASEEAREAARRAGVLLPPGTTWVRPHVRGGYGETPGGGATGGMCGLKTAFGAFRVTGQGNARRNRVPAISARRVP